MTRVQDAEQAAANARLHGLDRAGEIDGTRILRSRSVPPLPVRLVQHLALERGLLSFERHWLEPLGAVRRSALGTAAAQTPRFLVRVDEFPDSAGLDDPRLGREASAGFFEVLAEAGVPHLLAVVPQWTHDPRNPAGEGSRALDERDLALLARMRAGGVTFAQHGSTHRTRHANPRRHSELTGLSDAALLALLDRGRKALNQVGIEPRVLVPPYNRFEARQWPALSQRYDVITGGPETVRLLGFHGGPLWRGAAVYLPCYPPLYGRAAGVLRAIGDILRRGIGGWIPIVLHMGWELEDRYAALGRLAREIAPHAADWDGEFLPAVARSRPR